MIGSKEADDSRDVKLLDYACGTGSITKALGPYVDIIRGIDISERMVERYNEAAQSSGLTPGQARAVVGNLFEETVPDDLCTPDFYNFDIAVIGLGFHHFENPVLSVQRLVERLKAESGVLVIVDFLPFEQEKAPEANLDEIQITVKHHGFTSINMKKIFTHAGLEGFGFEVLDDPAVMELKEGTRERKIFIARGRKQPTAWGKVSKWVSGSLDSISDQVKSSTEPRVPPQSFNHLGGTQDFVPKQNDVFGSGKTWDMFGGTRG